MAANSHDITADARIEEINASLSTVLASLSEDTLTAYRDAALTPASKRTEDMATLSDVLGTDRADDDAERAANATIRVANAGQAARRTVLRESWVIVSGWESKAIRDTFGVKAATVSQVKRGQTRLAQYDALGIADDDRWSVTDREKRNDGDWDKHLAHLTEAGDIVPDDVTDGDDTPSVQSPAPVTVASVVKAIEAATAKVAELGDVDDVDASEIANAMAALTYATEAYAVTF